MYNETVKDLSSDLSLLIAEVGWEILYLVENERPMFEGPSLRLLPMEIGRNDEEVLVSKLNGLAISSEASSGSGCKVQKGWPMCLLSATDAVGQG